MLLAVRRGRSQGGGGGGGGGGGSSDDDDNENRGESRPLEIDVAADAPLRINFSTAFGENLFRGLLRGSKTAGEHAAASTKASDRARERRRMEAAAVNRRARIQLEQKLAAFYRHAALDGKVNDARANATYNVDRYGPVRALAAVDKALIATYGHGLEGCDLVERLSERFAATAKRHQAAELAVTIDNLGGGGDGHEESGVVSKAAHKIRRNALKKRLEATAKDYETAQEERASARRIYALEREVAAQTSHLRHAKASPRAASAKAQALLGTLPKTPSAKARALLGRDTQAEADTGAQRPRTASMEKEDDFKASVAALTEELESLKAEHKVYDEWRAKLIAAEAGEDDDGREALEAQAAADDEGSADLNQTSERIMNVNGFSKEATAAREHIEEIGGAFYLVNRLGLPLHYRCKTRWKTSRKTFETFTPARNQSAFEVASGQIHACILRDDGNSEEDRERHEAIAAQGLIAATGIKTKEIKAVFQDADEDDGGFLDTTEVEAMLRRILKEASDRSPDIDIDAEELETEIQKFLEAADKDGSGEVARQAFAEHFFQIERRCIDAQLRPGSSFLLSAPRFHRTGSNSKTPSSGAAAWRRSAS